MTAGRTRLDQIADAIQALETKKKRVGKLDAAKLTPEDEIKIDILNTQIRALEIERQQIERGQRANIPHKDSRTGNPL